MRFDAKTITLKDGRLCTLRPTTPDYAAEMIDYLKVTSAESPFLLREPDEVNYTLDTERDILGRLLQDERSVMMLAEVDGQVAGNCSINALSDKRRIMHRCSMAIALKKAFWGLGIGTAMINYLTELAQIIGYEQMELEVVDGNDQAIRLYRKCGFIETGRHMRAMKYSDGSFRDELLMYKPLRKKLIAICGLDCETCEARLATIHNDDALRAKVAASWSLLNNAKITSDMINCEGCRIDGVKTPFCDSICSIRQCALSKQHNTCGDCASLETCEKVGMILSSSPEAKKNLT